jgi:uncharacterized protein YkwD
MMGQRKLFAAVAAAATLLAAAGWNQPDDRLTSAIVEAHNRERAKEGKKPLALSPKLCSAAEIHAKDMAAHSKLEHKGSDGSTAVDRIKRVHYTYIRVGENIANGVKDVDGVVKMWMTSPGHRANILADFTELGAAQAEDDQGVVYWCVDFGIPMPRLKPDEAAAAVVERINRDRETAHQPVLKVDPALARGAMSLCRAIAERNSLEFEGDPFGVIDAKEVRGRELRLGVASGAPTADEAIKSLLTEDPADLATFREIGVGYAIAKNGTPYWCAFLAKPGKEMPPGPPRKDAPKSKTQP